MKTSQQKTEVGCEDQDAMLEGLLSVADLVKAQVLLSLLFLSSQLSPF